MKPRLMERKSQDSLAVIVICLVCLVLYINSLGNTFIFDDRHTIVENLYIKDVRYIPLFFKGHYTSDITIPRGMFRPLLLLTFSFNYLFSGLNPVGYHIINILLHFLNGILLYSLIRFFKKDIPFSLSLIISLFFISHPINTETVAYIACRSDLLVTFFILSGFLAYAKGQNLFSLFLYILALLTKENGLIFPFLIFAYDFILANRQKYLFKDSKEKMAFYITLFGLFILYWVFKKGLFPQSWGILEPLHSPLRSFWANILTQAVVTLFYLKLFFWPHPLTIHHAFPIINSWFNPLAILSVSVIILIIILIFYLRKRYPLISLGLAWYLICLLPKFYAILNIVAAEHHFYLPSFGIYLVLVVLLQPLYLRFRRKFIYIAAAIISIFGVLVLFRNYEWKDSFTLWRKAVRADPYSAASHHNLAIEYVNIGLYPEAEEELRKTLLFSKGLDRVEKSAGENLANIYRLQKRFPEALDELYKSLSLKPDDFTTLQNLGVVYLDMGEEVKAVEIWQKGLQYNPQASGLHINLGLHYMRKDNLELAREHFQSAIKSDPDAYLAYASLGYVYERELNLESAIKAYEKSIALNPAYLTSRYNVSRLYALKGDYANAIKHLKIAIKLYPNFAEAHNNLAVLYASMDPPQLELARQHAQKAVVLGYKVEEGFLKIIDLPQSQGLHETK